MDGLRTKTLWHLGRIERAHHDSLMDRAHVDQVIVRITKQDGRSQTENTVELKIRIRWEGQFYCASRHDLTWLARAEFELRISSSKPTTVVRSWRLRTQIEQQHR